jgi:hypothetical protein
VQKVPLRQPNVAEIADRTQHFQPVAERNAKVFEMLVGQVANNPSLRCAGTCQSRFGTRTTPS